MKLLHDYVAIKRDLIEETTSSGIYLNNQITTPPPTGVVKHVGKEVKSLKAGDKVLYKVMAGIDVPLEGGLDFVVEDNVMAKL
jgi:co-chaperonin GroES (HSP10)